MKVSLIFAMRAARIDTSVFVLVDPVLEKRGQQESSQTGRFSKKVESLCWYQTGKWCLEPAHQFLELLIIDEAQRLSATCLEVVRDFSKKHKLGVMLVRMQGFQYRIHNLDHINSYVGFYLEVNASGPQS